MLKPDFKEFKLLSKDANIVPVYKEILADTDTPVSTYLKLCKDEPYAYLLESVEGGERWGRYSFISWAPKKIFISKGSKFAFFSPKEKPVWKNTANPIDELKYIMSEVKFKEIKGLPRFCGGAVGYLSYDVVRFIEKLENKPEDKVNLPDMVFLLTDHMVIFDHLTHTAKIVVCVDLNNFKSAQDAYSRAENEIDNIVVKLNKPFVMKKSRECKSYPLLSNHSRQDYVKKVNKAKEYIKAGDIIQVVPSQKFRRKTDAEPFDIYRALRLVNPSPYMYFLKLENFEIVGSSPEILVRKEDSTAETRPIAGTSRRGKDKQEEKELINKLLCDPKERAEHIMLVDLGRNDLGRVCIKKTVRVPSLMDIEKYSHVIHIASSVTGELKPGIDSFDLLKACFPAGTVSGAPKIRAMEIIDELEPEARGIYAGATGYFSYSGNMDMAITIRTIFVKDKTAYGQAGAGIVADSIGENEYQETLNKAGALFEAINLAEKGL